MKRVPIFEFEDLPWFPEEFRNSITDMLQMLHNLFGVYEPVVPLIKRVMQHMKTTNVIDLCSGAGGPWLKLVEDDWPTSIKLTDKYPNIKAAKDFVARSAGQIEYITESVDAANVPADFAGIRTMFTTFHHFSPNVAKAILKDTVEQQTAICIFEIVDRKILTLLMAPILVPQLFYLGIPFTKSVSLSRFFWTYGIPIIPAAATWDGVASTLKAYSPQELKELAYSIDSKGFIWEIGQITFPESKVPITYLLGYPKNPK